MNYVSDDYNTHQTLNLNNAHVVDYKAHLHTQTIDGTYQDAIMNTRFFDELEYAIYPISYAYWPDGTYCLEEDLYEYSFMSDDYSVMLVPDSVNDPYEFIKANAPLYCFQ